MAIFVTDKSLEDWKFKWNHCVIPKFIQQDWHLIRIGQITTRVPMDIITVRDYHLEVRGVL